LQLIGREQYDQLYKQACFLVDDEICNQYGEDVEVSYQNSGCTGIQINATSARLTSKIHVSFLSDRDRQINCYAEVESIFARGSVSDLTVTYFDDNVPYE
jgi:hypothetical protein